MKRNKVDEFLKTAIGIPSCFPAPSARTQRAYRAGRNTSAAKKLGCSRFFEQKKIRFRPSVCISLPPSFPPSPASVVVPTLTQQSNRGRGNSGGLNRSNSMHGDSSTSHSLRRLTRSSLPSAGAPMVDSPETLLERVGQLFEKRQLGGLTGGVTGAVNGLLGGSNVCVLGVVSPEISFLGDFRLNSNLFAGGLWIDRSSRRSACTRTGSGSSTRSRSGYDESARSGSGSDIPSPCTGTGRYSSSRRQSARSSTAARSGTDYASERSGPEWRRKRRSDSRAKWWK